MTKLTLKSIAAHFKVSVSTVSKAINDSHEISESLKDRIRSYARLHHYRPNRMAVNLVHRKTRTIGVVIPNILNYFFVQVLYGIEQVANEKGYSIITCSTNESIEKESKILDFLCSGSVDGVIISTVAGETQLSDHISHFRELLDNQIPLVMFDRVTDLIDCDKIVVDDFEASFKATSHFIETGCSNIALINPIAHSTISRLRIDGHRKALLNHSIKFDEKLIITVDKDDDVEFVMSLLLDFDKVDGILVFDEITTVKVMNIIQSKGYIIPDDIAIIGFTNGELSKYVSPSATMISQHGKYIGESSATKLISRIENSATSKDYETKTIKTSLIIRESTRKNNNHKKVHS